MNMAPYHVCATCKGKSYLLVHSAEFPADPPHRVLCCSCEANGWVDPDRAPFQGQLHADDEATVLAKYSSPGLKKVELSREVKALHLEAARDPHGALL